ncbi:MAG: hypothetical protein ABIJ34_00465 [archaeon]
MKRYTREQLIFFLKKISSSLGRSPRISDMDKNKKYPSSTTYLKRFRTWNNALKIADLKINVRRKYEEKELIESLRQLSREMGRTPKSKDLRDRKWIASSATYAKYFGSWRQALTKSGVVKDKIISLKKYADKK